jgi:sirohydrochlorin cobaltochelatase
LKRAVIQGVILFAHGSRDPEWARPFERLAEELKRRLPNALVSVAYLESMRPTLPEAMATTAAAGARDVRIVPVFLGQGGHVKDDLPRLLSQLQAEYPDVQLSLGTAIGEDPAVIEAIAAAIARAS